MNTLAPASGGKTALLIVATALALMTGCGSTAKPAARTQIIAALGDSITAGSPAWDPDPGVRARLGDGANPESQYEYWAQVHAGRGVLFRNCGVFGERTDEIARRYEACTRGAGTVIVQGGINDIAQLRSVDSAAANLEALVRRAKADGKCVLMTNVLPWNNGSPDTAVAIRRLNRLIAAVAARERIPLLDFNAALADRRDPDRMARTLTAEGDHPSVAGYRRLGELIRLGDPAGR